MAMRQPIREAGGEVHFGAKVSSFEISDSCIRAVTTTDGQSFESDRVILATRHSARDIYPLLHRTDGKWRMSMADALPVL